MLPQSLGLGNNKIGDAGLKLFSEVVASGVLPQLVTLFLSGNQIGDPGLTSFSGALASGALPALQNVYLSGNPGDARPIKKVLAQRKK